MPETERQWFERMCALKRIRQQLRRHGVLIQMQLLLRDELSGQAAFQLLEAFRRTGFVAYRIERTSISLTGEPCLALAFIDRAAAAGVLSQAFQDCLNELFDDDTPRPRRQRARTKPLSRLLDAIRSVDVPPHRAFFATLH